MLRDDADFFSTRYDDMVREPDSTWREWVAEAADGEQKALFVADENGRWLGVVGGFVRVDPQEVQLISMWVDRAARGRGIAPRPDPRARPLDRRSAARAASCCSCRRRTSRRSTSTSGPASSATGDRAPASAGRSAFKLVLAASVRELLA